MITAPPPLKWTRCAADVVLYGQFARIPGKTF